MNYYYGYYYQIKMPCMQTYVFNVLAVPRCPFAVNLMGNVGCPGVCSGISTHRSGVMLCISDVSVPTAELLACTVLLMCGCGNPGMFEIAQ